MQVFNRLEALDKVAVLQMELAEMEKKKAELEQQVEQRAGGGRNSSFAETISQDQEDVAPFSRSSPSLADEETRGSDLFEKSSNSLVQLLLSREYIGEKTAGEQRSNHQLLHEISKTGKQIATQKKKLRQEQLKTPLKKFQCVMLLVLLICGYLERVPVGLMLFLVTLLFWVFDITVEVRK